MRRMIVRAGLISLLVFATRVEAQQPTAAQTPGESRLGAGDLCPPGTTEIRPRLCRAPESPAPGILDYHPRSTLITPAHIVSRAKYPAIDYHGHPNELINSAEGLAQLGAALDSLNVRLMVAADNLSGERLRRAVAA